MTEIKIVERIDDLINKLDYKKAYLEIETGQNKYIIERHMQNQIGFKI